jgi:hypothetical protein
MSKEPFDIKKLRLTEELFNAAHATKVASEKVKVTKTKHKREHHFIKMPWSWLERLSQVRNRASFLVILVVLYQHWKHKSRPFTLRNSTVSEFGITRWQKWTALGELEALGLITVDRRDRKAPLIRVNLR